MAVDFGKLWEFFTRQKVLLTLVYCGAFLCLGLLLAGLGPSLPTLGRNTNTADKKMGATVTSRALGYLAGSTSGPVFHKLPGNKMVAVSLVVTCLVCFLVPVLTNFAILCTLFFFQGVSMGMLDTGCNLMTLWLHKENCDPYIQSLHAAFAVGAVISPGVLKAFLSAHKPINWAWYGIGFSFVPIIALLLYFPSPTDPTDEHLDSDENSEKTTSGDEGIQLEETTDYTINTVTRSESQTQLGGEAEMTDFGKQEITSASPDPMLTPRAPTPSSPNATPRSQNGSSAKQQNMFAFSWENRYNVDYKPYLTVLGVAVFLCFYVGGEVATGSFTTTFALRRGLTTEDGGAFLTFLFWLTFAIGRLLAIPLSVFISPKLMLTVDLIGTFISVLFIWTFANRVVGLGISLFVYGLFMASTFPTAITLLQTIMPVTGNMTTVFIVGASLGEMLVPLLVSANFEATNYMSLIYVQFGSVIAGIITMITVAVLGHMILKQRDIKRRLEEKIENLRIQEQDTQNSITSITKANQKDKETRGLEMHMVELDL